MLKAKYKNFESTSDFRPARKISLVQPRTIALKVKKACESLYYNAPFKFRTYNLASKKLCRTYGAVI